MYFVGMLLLLCGTHPRRFPHLVPLHRDDLLVLILAEPDQPRVVPVVSERVLGLSTTEFSVVKSEGRRMLICEGITGKKAQNYPHISISMSSDISSLKSKVESAVTTVS